MNSEATSVKVIKRHADHRAPGAPRLGHPAVVGRVHVVPALMVSPREPYRPVAFTGLDGAIRMSLSGCDINLVGGWSAARRDGRPALVPRGRRGAQLHPRRRPARHVAVDAQPHDQAAGGPAGPAAPHPHHAQRRADRGRRAAGAVARATHRGDRGRSRGPDGAPGQTRRRRAADCCRTTPTRRSSGRGSGRSSRTIRTSASRSASTTGCATSSRSGSTPACVSAKASTRT